MYRRCNYFPIFKIGRFTLYPSGGSGFTGLFLPVPTLEILTLKTFKNSLALKKFLIGSVSVSGFDGRSGRTQFFVRLDPDPKENQTDL